MPKRRRLVYIVASIVLLVAVLMAAQQLYESYRNAPLTGFAPTTLVFDKGGSLKQMAQTLSDQHILDSSLPFMALAWWQGKAHRLQAGEYAFAPGITPQQLLDKLVRGEVVQHRFTIVEGWTFRQLLMALNAQPALRHTLVSLDDAQVMAALGFPGEHPEGRFLPDTYVFVRGTTDSVLLRRAHQAMRSVLAQDWAQKAPDVPLHNADEALILASIVEKETALANERPRIAQVFLRRLQLDMPLQTDPSVIYGLGTSFDGNLRRAQLQTDTPYNSYRRRGLPPTPICMPGRAALAAVLHPQAGEDLYFVAKGDGSHHFSATFDEHRRAVACYQLKQCKEP